MYSFDNVDEPLILQHNGCMLPLKSLEKKNLKISLGMKSRIEKGIVCPQCYFLQYMKSNPKLFSTMGLALKITFRCSPPAMMS